MTNKSLEKLTTLLRNKGVARYIVKDGFDSSYEQMEKLSKLILSALPSMGWVHEDEVVHVFTPWYTELSTGNITMKHNGKQYIPKENMKNYINVSELPEKNTIMHSGFNTDYNEAEKVGWNACLDEILSKVKSSEKPLNNAQMAQSE